MADVIGIVYEFGAYRLDAARRLLTRDGQHLTLPPKTFDLLILLVESRGRVFTKKELMGALWPNTFVEDANLSFQISSLRKTLGGGIEWIETLPRYGYRFAGDVIEIDPGVPAQHNMAGPPEPAAAVPGPSIESKSKPAYYWLPVLLLTLVTGYFAIAHLREAPPVDEHAVTFLISPPDGTVIPDVDSIAVSPSGDRVAFIGVGRDGGKQLWMRPLGSITPEPIPGTELVDGSFWSPDNRYLAFFAAGKLKRWDSQGGAPERICDTPPGRSSGAWSRNGVILFETAEHPELYTVPSSGGIPKVATRLDPANQETRHAAPQFLPDGRHFLFFVQSDRAENTGIYVGSLDSPSHKLVASSAANGVYTRVGDSFYLLFPRGANLMGQAFDPNNDPNNDPNKVKLTGAPFVVAQRLLIPLTGGFPWAAVSASENGVIAYRTRIETGSTDLAWFDRSGQRLKSIGPPADYSNPALSPDESHLVVSRVDPQTRTRDLWLFDFASGASSRFTFDPADETNAVWSPDGKRIAFNAAHNGVVDIYEKEIAGASESKLLLHSSENKYIHGWSADGKLLLFRIGPITWALPTSTGKLLGPFPLENPRISPNGKWVAYTSTQSGRSEVFVQNFPPSEGKWQISTMGGTEPSWRADGKELYFSNGDKLFAARVKTDPTVFEPGPVKPLFGVALETVGRRSRYQAASNGQRFLVNVPLESSSPVTVSTAWLPRSAR